MAPQQTQVGHVGGAFGVKGWVKIHSDTVPTEKIFDYQPWRLLDHRGREISGFAEVQVVRWQASGKQLVAQLQSVQDRNDAERLKGARILVPMDRFEPLQAGDYYWHQLIGLQVVVTRLHGSELAQPLLLGRLDRMMETGANDVLVVAPTQDSIDSRERLLPWVPEQYVLRVDLAAERLEVDWDPEF